MNALLTNARRSMADTAAADRRHPTASAASAAGAAAPRRHPPADTPGPRPHGEAPAGPAAARPSEPGTGRPRVLVVEDDPFVRYELVALLDDEGIEVVGEAADGAAGVALARQSRPDVVLMDLRMPRMGGTEATRLIKSGLPRTQVILLSAYDDAGLREGGIHAGACAYLVKGCPAGVIVDAIHDAWQRTRGPGRHEEHP